MGPDTIARGGRWWMQGSVDPLMNMATYSPRQTAFFLC